MTFMNSPETDDTLAGAAPAHDAPVAGRRRARRHRRRPRLRMISPRFLLPNLITLLAVCAGVTAIRLGVDGRFELAAGAVILAAVLDALDGRLARLLKGTSRFGAELDSLADFVNFGVVPAMLIYLWSLHALNNLGWVVALALVIACALRLARFNVMLEDDDRPEWHAAFFIGIPAPAGALLAISPMFLGFLGLAQHGAVLAPVIAVWVALVALGMISRLPTFSGKRLTRRIPREWVLPLLAALVLTSVLLIAFPWHMMTLAAVAYVISLPLAWKSWKRLAQAHEQELATEPEETAAQNAASSSSPSAMVERQR